MTELRFLCELYPQVFFMNISRFNLYGFCSFQVKIGNDPAGWLSVSPETGVIKVRALMDRESAYVKDGKYKAIIWAVDNDGNLCF